MLTGQGRNIGGAVLSTAAQYAGTALTLGLGAGGMGRLAGHPGNNWFAVIGIAAIVAGTAGRERI